MQTYLQALFEYIGNYGFGEYCYHTFILSYIYICMHLIFHTLGNKLQDLDFTWPTIDWEM